jgi:thiamine biosynthesis protein ThiS
MRITINGEAHDIDASSVDTVSALLTALGLPAERVAIEHNGAIVRRPERAQTLVQDGDVFEIVTLVGGG